MFLFKTDKHCFILKCYSNQTVILLMRSEDTYGLKKFIELVLSGSVLYLSFFFNDMESITCVSQLFDK